jgi:hypothetical protein
MVGVVNSELERMWKEAAIVCAEVLFRNLLGGSD